MYGVLAPQATASVARGAPKNATVHLAPSWRLSDAPDRGPSIFWLFLQFFLCLNFFVDVLQWWKLRRNLITQNV